MTQLIYSTEAVPRADGRKVKNPRHFLAPLEGVTKVYIAGHWPRVRQAYEAAGISVAPLEEMRAMPGKGKSAEQKPADGRPDKPGSDADANPA